LGNCAVIQWDRTAFAHPYLPIDRPGKYCIDQDYHLRCINGAGSCGGGSLIEIMANDVDLDLKGHTLSRKGRAFAIIGRGRNITVKNGIIQNGSILINTPDSPTGPINGDEPMREFTLDESGFIRVENMRIESGEISVSGANVRIRHSEVVLGSGYLAPISVYGPGAVIEHNRLKRITSPSRFHDYGIYLRNGRGGLIRDNVIENEGAQENTFAFGLRNSQGVMIENNRLRNFSKIIERLGQSDERQIGNIFQ
jgi:polygalacturonase